MNPSPLAQTSLSRRRFLVAGALATGTKIFGGSPPATTQPDAKGFFTIARRGGRWWFTTPEGAPFFSIALNHIDDAPLRHAESGNIWREKYANSRERWLKQAVAPDLRAWGFNSVGWTQEVVVRGQTIHRHSPPFTFEKYQWLGLPDCHLLPISGIHQWEFAPRHSDFFSARTSRPGAITSRARTAPASAACATNKSARTRRPSRPSRRRIARRRSG